ncbi:MAG: hypothetical protein K2I54_09395, partial [Muribaculaceae bacterium]|nr:hypothetical protein [Muribaculaceae bacterium]
TDTSAKDLALSPHAENIRERPHKPDKIILILQEHLNRGKDNSKMKNKHVFSTFRQAIWRKKVVLLHSNDRFEATYILEHSPASACSRTAMQHACSRNAGYKAVYSCP